MSAPISKEERELLDPYCDPWTTGADTAGKMVVGSWEEYAAATGEVIDYVDPVYEPDSSDEEEISASAGRKKLEDIRMLFADSILADPPVQPTARVSGMLGWIMKDLEDEALTRWRRYGAEQEGEIEDEVTSSEESDEGSEGGDDLEYTADAFDLVVKLTPHDDSRLPNRLHRLATALCALGGPANVSRALCTIRSAIAHTPTTDPLFQHQLAHILHAHFEATHDSADLDEAISVQQAIVDALTPNATVTEYTGEHCQLGNYIFIRYRVLRDPKDLDRAIALHRTAAGPSDAMDYPRVPSNLDTMLVVRFRRQGAVADVDEALRIARTRHARRLSVSARLGATRQLAGALVARYEHLGRISDLDEAIGVLRRMADSTTKNSPVHATQMADIDTLLGVSLRLRYEMFEDEANLEEAVVCHRSAVARCPETHRSYSGRFVNLSLSLLHLFDAAKSRAVLDEGVRVAEKAQILCEGSGQTRLHYHAMTNLATLLVSRYELYPESSDVDRAVALLQQSVDMTTVKDPDRLVILSSLASALSARFEHGRADIADLDNAIEICTDILNSTGSLNTLRANRAFQCANLLRTRFLITRDLSDYHRALDTFTETTNSDNVSVLTRFDAAKIKARLAHSTNDLLQAMDAYNLAIALLPSVSWSGTTTAQRMSHMGRAVGLAADAAACAISLSRTEIALEIIDRTNCVVWTQIIQQRADLQVLRERAPELANRLQELSSMIEGKKMALDTVELDGMWEEEETRRRIAYRDWDTTVEKVRQLPGMENFLLPLPYTVFRPPSKGIIVVINGSQYRTDALFIDSFRTEIGHIHLDRIDDGGKALTASTQDCLKNAGTFRGDENRYLTIKRAKRGNTAGLQNVLASLWHNIAEPILTHLGITHPTEELPRIWWCPAGELRTLPIHAAGLYSPDAVTVSVQDLVISSYIPNLSFLARPRSPDMSPLKLLAVAVPDATIEGKRLPYIPNTIVEVRCIQALASSQVEVLEGAEATVEAVIKALPVCNCVYFACHGIQIGHGDSHPLKSGFALANERLDLDAIISQRLPQTTLGYLSACETAMGDPDIPDEVVHLAAGLLMSGFQGVVATLFSIRDQDGPKVAEAFYTSLFRQGNPALSLHVAVEKLRAENVPLFAWMAYVYMG